MGSPLWFSSGVAAKDRAVANHKARLECIEAAIHQLGRLRSEYGYAIDQLPSDVNRARDALRKAYHNELERGAKLRPLPPIESLPSFYESWNPAMRGAFNKGVRAQLDGAPFEAPYADRRKESGRLTWSRAFIRAWEEGYEWAARRPGPARELVGGECSKAEAAP